MRRLELPSRCLDTASTPRAGCRARSRLNAVVAVLALAAAALVAPGAGVAAAASDTQIGMADDLLLFGHPDEAAFAVAVWRGFGVDVVRIQARWATIAPQPRAHRAPTGFHPGDPGDPHHDWGKLDRAVAMVRSQGLRVILQITGPAPVWASLYPRRGNPRWKPDRRAFAQFAGSVAGRYRADVDTYVVWNEPNNATSLQPQWKCRHRECAPVSPHTYRGLVRAGYPAIKAADPGAQVLIGALAPRGRRPRGTETPMRPLRFLREMGCVDRHLKPRAHGACKDFHPATGDGLAYNPHGGLSAPHASDPQRDNARIGDLGRLERTLDALSLGIRIVATTVRFDLYLTDFGYETYPPDAYHGVVPEIQGPWLAQAGFLAWRDPRVKALVHDPWRDEPLISTGAGARAYGGSQAGLVYADGVAKPGFYDFPQPFYARLSKDKREIVFWGQVRPGQAHDVVLERRALNHNDFQPALGLRTNQYGYWFLRAPAGAAADYRFSYEVPGSGPSARPVRVYSAIEHIRPG
jgi:hypothetical protein